MPLPRLALAVIGDEIGPTLDEMISFAQEHDIKRLDMRTVAGRNLLGMTNDEVIEISRTLEKAGISVPTFVSPVLKWAAPGKAPAGGKVDFAFDPAECPAHDALLHAMDIAVILGARNLRIFSYLRYDGFQPSDIRRVRLRLRALIGHAQHYDIVLQLENEPVCNVGNIAELRLFFDAPEEMSTNATPGPTYLRPLVDIANAWSTGERPSDADIARWPAHHRDPCQGPRSGGKAHRAAG